MPARAGDFCWFPLSFTQLRLWFLNQIDPTSAVYNVPVGVRLNGPLNLPALQAGIEEIIKRHETLRTRFAVLNGQPVQIIDEACPVALELFGWRDRYERADVWAAAQESARRPFNLETGPLIRVCLGRLTQNEHVLVITMHHIVSDAWSMGILLRELVSFYIAYDRGARAEVPELSIQYADFAVWQRDQLEANAFATHLAYWKEQLTGAASELTLPHDHSRPPIQSFHGASCPVALSAEPSARLTRLCRQEGVSLFMALLALFQTLVFRYTGSTDISIGCPVANRLRTEVEDIIGPFVNTLVMRNRPHADMTFREFLRMTRETSLEAYAHQSLPFEKLVEVIAPERDLSMNPLFQTSFQLQNVSLVPQAIPGLELSPFLVETHNAKFDLALDLWEGQSGILGRIEYSTNLFEATTITRMVGHLLTLTAGVLDNPDSPLGSLALLTSAEEIKLRAWAMGASREEAVGSVPECIAAIAATDPDALAITCDNEKLTFRQLEAQSASLALQLQKLGVNPDSRVGLCLQRSVGLAVGIMGIWRGAGAFVPLDPLHPLERNLFILKDAGVSVVVSDLPSIGALPPEIQVVCMETAVGAERQINSAVTAATVSPDTLAYVIYTSGTTGRPKGVMVSHRQLANKLASSSRTFNFTRNDVVPCVSAETFDIFLFELMTVLLVGGRAAIVRNPLNIQEIFAAGPTMLHAVPTLMKRIVNYVASKPESIRQPMRALFVGGDVVSAELLNEMAKAFPGVPRHVLYGPTEATIICASYEVDGQNARHKIIGRPLENVKLRVCDQSGNDVPSGVRGEILIGGTAVTRGYISSPELNSERFVWLDNERFYRSGDLGRYLPDGNLEFVGRLDKQVKIRGFRVELEEVASALRRHPSVVDAAVGKATTSSGEDELVAYIKVHTCESLGLADYRKFLRGSLPSYMIPAKILVVNELPINAHHKVDLTVGNLPVRSTRSARVAPRDDLEQSLADAWTEVLGANGFGVDDNFFDVGGNSLLLLELHARLSSLSASLTIVDLFRLPTISELAEHFRQDGFEASTPAAAVAARARKHVQVLKHYQLRNYRPR
jgi:amino acid adenylation domain-containing protein